MRLFRRNRGRSDSKAAVTDVESYANHLVSLAARCAVESLTAVQLAVDETVLLALMGEWLYLLLHAAGIQIDARLSDTRAASVRDALEVNAIRLLAFADEPETPDGVQEDTEDAKGMYTLLIERTNHYGQFDLYGAGRRTAVGEFAKISGEIVGAEGLWEFSTKTLAMEVLVHRSLIVAFAKARAA